MHSDAPIHRFIDKLRQAAVLRDVEAYTSDLPRAGRTGLREFFGPPPVARGPLSINLDVTVACDHRCPHCIDRSILNSGRRLSLPHVADTLITLRMVGLRTVIFIGGGEPTLHPHFEEMVRVAASLGLHCGIVSNGGRPDRLARAAAHMGPGDWIRLSIDAGTQGTFQRVHRPLNGLTLEQACEGIGTVKRANPRVLCGFSFVIITPETSAAHPGLMPNAHEIVASARLARRHGFDYITFKPCLVRDADAKEVLPPASSNTPTAREPTGTHGPGEDRHASPVAGQLESAFGLETDAFRVIPGAGLVALFDAARFAAMRRQPRRCHMQALRQVVSPGGIYGCAAYRGDRRSLIAPSDGYVDLASFRETAARTAAQVETFDAAAECRDIACVYNDENWWIEGIEGETTAASARWGNPTASAAEPEQPVFL